MYNNIKSCVTCNKKQSDYFPSNVGENLSPILFSLFLNDLESYFSSNNNLNGTSFQTAENERMIEFLLYADDTVLLSESQNDLQNLLNEYEKYCDKWKLTVNLSK